MKSRLDLLLAIAAAQSGQPESLLRTSFDQTFAKTPGLKDRIATPISDSEFDHLFAKHKADPNFSAWMIAGVEEDPTDPPSEG